MYEDYSNFCTDELGCSYGTLCDRAISVMTAAFIADNPASETVFENKLTPIEQIFGIAYFAVSSKAEGSVEYPSNYSFGAVPLAIELEGIEAQKAVDIDGKKYVIDFMFQSKVLDCKGIAFELDGYDYHSTKEQMNRDYERERELQKAGYKVVRYTGSQVYRNPFKCAREAVDIIIGCLGGAVKR